MWVRAVVKSIGIHTILCENTRYSLCTNADEGESSCSVEMMLESGGIERRKQKRVEV